MFCVYVLQNKINLKIYVGKTKLFYNRLNDHFRIADGGKKKYPYTFSLIHSAINKHGKDNFEFTILESFYVETDALEAEQFWIEFFRTDINRYGNGNGYNLTKGGDGVVGRKHTVESKEKISKALTGRSVSDSFRKKMSVISKQREKWRFVPKEKIVWPNDIELVEMVLSTSARQVAKMLGVNSSTVIYRLNKRNLRP